MCNSACLDFITDALPHGDVSGRTVLEVGSLDVNGSPRSIVERLNPASYVGVDIQLGPGVDERCDAGALVRRFGEASVDVLVTTEMLEHIREWRCVVSGFKRILRPGGLLLITTRSKGFPYHGYPYDFWRFEASDMRALFADFVIERLDADPSAPGIFLKARKPPDFEEADVRAHALYSVVTQTRIPSLALTRWLAFALSTALRNAYYAASRRLAGRRAFTRSNGRRPHSDPRGRRP